MRLMTMTKGLAKKKTESKHELLEVFRLVYEARYTDEKTATLVKQNKGGTFQLSAKGHELVGVVCARQLRAGHDWALPYYRDQPFVIGLGADLKELFGAFMARETENHSAGRMMPYHFSHKKLRIPCQSSAVGSQMLQAAGIAHAAKLSGSDEVVYVSFGDGATSQGDFHEALNYSALHLLPVIFVIQDNGWAISVPIEEQTAGGSILPIVKGYPDTAVFDVDGGSYSELCQAMQDAVKRGRDQLGPSVIVAKVPRLASHSNSDDARRYRDAKEFAAAQKKDPLLRFEQWLLKEQGCTQGELDAIREDVRIDVEDAANAAEALPFPDKASVSRHLFVENDPVGVSLYEEPNSQGEKIVIIDAINNALREEMNKDRGIIVFGQDIAHNKGGVFGATRGLTEEFGVERCFNTPLAESTIIGVACGMAMYPGFRPVAEIQFADYMWTGINQLFNEVASIHYRSNGQWRQPLVIRMPYGGYIQGGPYHSQSVEGFLAHCPGLKIVIPSNAADAKGLLKMAIHDPNPVIFLEHKGLYRQQQFSARPEPSEEYLLPLGQAKVVREGSDITFVGYGMMILMAAAVADKLSYHDVSVEVIDLRTIVPLDIATILESVKKTGKLLVAHEGARNCGFGAEVAARISEEAFEYLDAPVQRVCGLDAHIPYSKPLENAVLPQQEDIENAINHLHRY
ncbi:MFS transporter [Simkania negevensis]|uniref:3-methyl-2-oxobutanoate dehydrogenase (2-methylpropanoyl-transferring) n=1 Tax=Simkania negevensis TaxID=83561 RepID=A0ABS3AQN1_9BACT|nr:MFS transporter [Simkania negevensis]